MSIYIRTTNRLTKPTSIRSGTATARQRYPLRRNTDAEWGSHCFVGLALRCLAILGLFFASYLLFQPYAANVIAKPSGISLETARLSLENGEATIVRVDGRFDLATSGAATTVTSGDMIIVDGSPVELNFAHGHVVLLDPGASITIEQLERTRIEGQGFSQRSQMVLWSGSLTYTSPSESAQTDYFYVSSPSSASTVEQGTLFMEVISPVHTNYAMLGGERATVQMGQQTIQLESAQKLAAILGDPLVVETGTPVEQPTEQRQLVAQQSTESLVAQPSNLIEFSAPTETHIVQAGDTLWSIAQKYNMDVEALMLANPSITNAELLRIEQQIYIPTEFAATTLVSAN